MTSALRLVAALVLALGVGCTAPCAESPTFEFEVGVWSGSRVDVASGSRATMRMRVERSVDGYVRFLEIGEGSYRGAAVQAWDARSETWVRTYANSSRRGFARYRAEEIARARTVWRSITPGRTRESRLISEHRSDGTWRRTMSVSRGGAVWTELWIDTLQRLPHDESSPAR